MKKLIFIIAASLLVTGAAKAQEKALVTPKLFDNVYAGITAGGSTKTTHNAFFGDMGPTVDLFVGKNITPIFGLRADCQGYFDNTWPDFHSRTFVKGFDLNLLGTINLGNLFYGYYGNPRDFEVLAIAGTGWYHLFDNDDNPALPDNFLSTKMGFDFTYRVTDNLRILAEPAIHYGFDRVASGFNVNNSWLTFTAGIIYNFGPGFELVDPRSQAEIDLLNEEINKLRARKPEIRVIEKVVKDVQYVDKTYVVEFAQNSSVLSNRAKVALDNIPTASTVSIVASASPEGSSYYNQRLSQARANAVKEYLEEIRGIKVSEAIGNGVFDGTSNRIAVITVIE